MTQKEALDILKTGRNVFLTGAAGSGKTHTLREYISYLKSLNAEVAITASTGIAATHMGGTTIHSWSGLGIRDSLSDHELAEIADKSYVRNRIKNTAVLIIDEVSMLHHFRLDLIDAVLRTMKGSHEPFGGIQVVLCGDFFQLPPISKGYETESLFAYHSEAWRSLELKVCYLEEQHRQDDGKFLKVLNAIRDNEISKEILEILNTRLNADTSSFVSSTKLYSHNMNVDNENGNELEKISGRTYEYVMSSRGSRNLVEALKKSCLAPEVLRLKQGAKVMFVKNNFEEGYVNGTLGVVERLDKYEIIVRTFSGVNIEVKQESWRIEEDGKVKAEISQYPLRLAWAITVHKSQGMSLDSAEVDLSQCFERGMGYVALSRVRSLAGLCLKGLNDVALQVSTEVLEYDDNFRGMSEKNVLRIKKMGGEISELHKQFKNKISQTRASGKIQKPDTVAETKRLFKEGNNLKQIARERKLKEGTIIDHFEKIKEEDPDFSLFELRNSLPKAKFQKIYAAFQKVGVSEGNVRLLGPVKNILDSKFSYDELRLVRLFL